MLGFRCKVVTLAVARSVARCCSNIAPAVSDSENGDERSVLDSALTVSYLVDSCGFTQEAATIAAKKVKLKSTAKADKVLSLLRAYGFKNADLFRLLQKRPKVIAIVRERSLKPKLDILASLGPSQDLLVKVLIRCPEILHNSLNKTLVPSLEFLRRILGSDENVLKSINYCHRLLQYKLPSLLGPNLAILREVGMPDDLISAFLKDRPCTLLSSPARLRMLVDRAREVGFDPTRYGFIGATCALAAINDKTWKQKTELFKKWGWSDDEVIYAFKRCPQSMTTSRKKVDAFMYYFVNTLKLDASFVAKNSMLLNFSLEERIIPRCSIIQYLLLKGVLGMKDFTLRNVLTVSEDYFSRKFVLKHEKTLPELSELYTEYKNGAAKGICQPVCSRDTRKYSNKIQLD